MQMTHNTVAETVRVQPDTNDTVNALRILLIEDDTLVSMLLAEVLIEMGHEVCAIETTEAGGVAAALRDRPDLMIVDERLSEGSGTAAVERILRNGPLPHILASGGNIYPKPGTVVLHKPYKESDLILAMKRAFDLQASASQQYHLKALDIFQGNPNEL